jgi:hypothetical protein
MGVINLNQRMNEVEKAAADGIALANAAQATADKTFISTGNAATDVNDILTPGIYSRLTGVSDVSNRPASNPFILEVIQMTGNAYYTLQRWTDCTTGKTYQRVYRKSNTTWTEWAELAFVTT